MGGLIGSYFEPDKNGMVEYNKIAKTVLCMSCFDKAVSKDRFAARPDTKRTCQGSRPVVCGRSGTCWPPGATRMPGPAQNTQAQNTQEPVAWAVVRPDDEVTVVVFRRSDAGAYATGSDRVVPLYRHPQPIESTPSD